MSEFLEAIGYNKSMVNALCKENKMILNMWPEKDKVSGMWFVCVQVSTDNPQEEIKIECKSKEDAYAILNAIENHSGNVDWLDE